MKPTELDSLIKLKEQPCISIILSVDRLDARITYLAVKSALNKVTGLLKRKDLDDNVRTVLQAKVDSVLSQLSLRKGEGLGIFISPSVSITITFPFEVKPKVMVNENFELRDVFYLRQFTEPYLVLNLSKHGAQLYNACMDQLTEIKDAHFPIEYTDPFEYQRASPGNQSGYSLKGFEKDKAEISHIRLKTVLGQADEYLNPHLLNNDTNLLLAGSQKLIASFLALTSFRRHFFGKVIGSYSKKNVEELADKAWRVLIENKKKEMERIVVDLQERKNGPIAKGLSSAWKAASEGKGMLLVVEKDFHRKAYKKGREIKFSSRPPRSHYKTIPDAVDDLIEMVNEKSGKIIFTDNDELKQLGHLAMELRY